MAEVKFTQFLFPDRQRKETTLEGVSEQVAAHARELQEAGWRFECECHPRTQIVYADVCCAEGTLENMMEPNGPKVPPAIEAMVERAWTRWTEAGRPAVGTVAANVLLAEQEMVRAE